MKDELYPEFVDALAREWAERVPREFRNADVRALDPPEVREGVERWLAQVTDTEDDPRVRGRNLVLTGPVGCGKSYAGFAALRRLHFDGTPSNQRFAKGRLVRRSFRYWSVPKALSRLRERDATVWEELMEARVLMLDDVGGIGAKASEWTLEQLFTIFDTRWADQRPIVATSNLDEAGLRDYLGEPAYSRLVNRSLLLRVQGLNRREKPRLEVVEGEGS